MTEELSLEERSTMELEEFLREFIDVLNKKFEEQKASIDFLKTVGDSLKDEVSSIRQEMLEIRGDIISIKESISKLTEKQNKISRDILGAILD